MFFSTFKRVSWIEDGVWLPPPRSQSSLDPRSSMELDSLSISSMEDSQDDPDTLTLSHVCVHPSAQRLADKVKNRLSAVGQAIGGLVSHKKRLAIRVQELGERRGGEFAEERNKKKTIFPKKRFVFILHF